MTISLKLRFGKFLLVRTNSMVINTLWFISRAINALLAMTMPRAKETHRHYEEQEKPYIFKGIDKLFEDFYKDLRRHWQ